ncbi:hypothetical protein LCGC14_2824110, partial [marine sediment metagenome]
MSFIAVAIIAGTAITAYSQIQAGKQAERDAKAQQESLNQQAALKERQAKAELERSQEEARQFKKEGEALQGTQQVTIAKGGVLSTVGTPAFLLEETAQELEADRLAILREGFLAESFRLSEAENLRFQGRIAKSRGAAAKRGSRFAAAGSILS